ncbi:MAG: hypothetical protein V3V08_01630 [Nannocystaceae bacterium]
MRSQLQTIADLPFRARAALDLLGLEEDRLEPDLDYDEFGFSRVDIIELESLDTGIVRELREPLLIAVHSADQQPENLRADIALEFYLHDDDDDDDDDDDHDETMYATLLSRFLDVHLEQILGTERDVVLVLCNPAHVRLRHPIHLAHRCLHYAEGRVVSWLDEFTDAHSRIRLSAPLWHSLRSSGRTEAP